MDNTNIIFLKATCKLVLVNQNIKQNIISFWWRPRLARLLEVEARRPRLIPVTVRGRELNTVTDRLHGCNVLT